jgi:hypothetical protein
MRGAARAEEGRGMRLTPLIAAGLAAASLGATACGTTTIDHADLERELTDQLGRSAGVAPKGVACPEDVEAEAGRRFDCTLTAPNGDAVRVAVTLTNEDGGFEAVVPPQQFR